MKNFFLLIFAIGFTLMGLIFLTLGAYKSYQGLKTHDWPSATGRIIESSIEEIISHEHKGTGYSLEILYSFEVAGNKYESKKISRNDKSYSELSAAEKQQALYPPGMKVEVYYDPENPKHSVLVKEAGLSWFVWLGALAFLLGLFVMIRLAVKPLRFIFRLFAIISIIKKIKRKFMSKTISSKSSG